MKAFRSVPKNVAFLDEHSNVRRLAMIIPKRLLDCFRANNIEYEILRHPQTVTAQRVAQIEHVKGRQHAKVVMVKTGDQYAMTVVPAHRQLDLEKVKKVIGKTASLATEPEFKSLFPDCAPGAMPPFGNLYGLLTYIDCDLTQQEQIVFEAGTHTDGIKLRYADYEKVATPHVADLAIKIHDRK